MINNIKCVGDPMILGFWSCRGRAGFSRLVLEYLGLDYKNNIYSDATQWFSNDKINLDIDFINLPYLIDGDIKITETEAINHYIIKKSGQVDLLGKSSLDQVKVLQYNSIVLDLLNSAFDASFAPKDNAQKVLEKKLQRTINPKLTCFDKAYQSKDWLLGYTTISDLYVYEICMYMDEFKCGILDGKDNLRNLMNRVSKLPQIEKYINSKRYCKSFLPERANLAAGNPEHIQQWIKDNQH